MADPNLSAIATTTLKNYRKTFADNVSNGNELSRYMQEKGARKLSGGETIVEELMYASANGGSYSGTDPMDITVPAGISAAEFNWKQYYATIPITGTEQLKNSGPQKLQSLMAARTKQAEIKLQNSIGTDIYGDGTGNSGKNLLGLGAICDTVPTSGTLGSINRATYSFWQNYTNTSAGSFATGGLAAISTAIRSLTRGKDRPTVMVTGSTIYGYAQNLAQGRAQFLNPALADLNFRALKIEGIDFLFDPQCTADRVYLLNLNYLKLNIHTDRNFVVRDFVEPADQDFMVGKYLLALQMSVSNCALQGVLSGWSA